jgi:hypothetical protein
VLNAAEKGSGAVTVKGPPVRIEQSATYNARVTASAIPSEAPGGRQAGPSNPALNPSAFQRGWSEAAPAERVGMTVGGTYVKTGVLLFILVLGAAFGWSQVDVVEVRGVPVALQPFWTWILIFVTLGLGIFAAFAIRAASYSFPVNQRWKHEAIRWTPGCANEPVWHKVQGST